MHAWSRPPVAVPGRQPVNGACVVAAKMQVRLQDLIADMLVEYEVLDVRIAAGGPIGRRECVLHKKVFGPYLLQLVAVCERVYHICVQLRALRLRTLPRTARS